MTQASGFQDVFKSLAAEAGTIPRRGLIYITIGTVTSILCELALWSHRPPFLPMDYALFAALAVIWFGVSYTVPMMMLNRPPSLPGFLRFMATYVALALPLMLALGLLVLGLKMGTAVVLPCLILVIAAGLLLPVLAGWPVLQSISPRFVEPFWALKSTRGIRWPMIAISFMAGGIGRLAPGVASADGIGTAVVLAAIGGAVTFLTAVIGYGAVVVCYRHMARAFPGPII